MTLFAPPLGSPGRDGLMQDALEAAASQLVASDQGRTAIPAPEAWEPWLRTMFPTYVRAGFAPRHVRFWEWVWSITPENDPRPFVGIWPRGGAKSTSAEMGTCALGLRGQRRYALYVRDTQDRADDSVSNVGSLLESGSVARHYPDQAERLVGKYGDSKGWRRNRLRTAGGFTVDALGLDVASRGVKLEEQRPDVIVFDDVDGRHDPPAATEKKLATIKDSLLPAGTANCAIIAIQNLIIPNGIFARLADGRADFLTRRVVSGPDPSLRQMRTKRRVDPETGNMRTLISRGRPTWAGQGLRECQQLLDRIGLASFEREAQHQVHDREGALWSRDLLNARRVGQAPPLKRIVVAVDPSGGGDDIGIVAAGLGYDNRGYVLEDGSARGRLGPLFWGQRTCEMYHRLQADRVIAEKNFGGDMVESNIQVANPKVPVKLVHASRGKAVRAEPVASLYADGRVDHVGAFPEMETEMTTWAPGDPHSPNRMDALVWALTELMLDPAPVPFVL